MLSENEIKELYNSTRESLKNINGVQKLNTDLAEHGDLLFDSKVKKFNANADSIRLDILVLSRLFQEFIQDNKLRKSVSKEQNKKKAVLLKWLKDQYLTYKQLLLRILSSCTKTTNNDIVLDCITSYMELFRMESEYWAPSAGNFFPMQEYFALVKALFLCGKGEVLPDGSHSSIAVLFFQEHYLSKFQDLKFYFLQCVVDESLAEFGEYEQFYSKWLTIMGQDFFKNLEDADEEMENNNNKENDDFGGFSDNSDGDEDDEDDDSDSESAETSGFYVPDPPQNSGNFAHTKALFTKLWLKLLAESLTEAQLKYTLHIFDKRVVPYIVRPEQFMDFFTSCYNHRDSLIVRILALNGLFQLMQLRNLEYPSFYKKLYSLVSSPAILTTKFRSRFFRLLDVCLSSTHLPAAIVGSFIKRLVRLSLNSNPGAVVLVLPFVYNLLKRHPACMIMIHNPLLSEEELANYADPFDALEQDPMDTHALESSLWELEALMTHYHPNVASLGKIFKNPFSKQSYNLEDFLDWSYASLMESESKRRGKEQMMALEHEESECLVGWTY